VAQVRPVLHSFVVLLQTGIAPPRATRQARVDNRRVWITCRLRLTIGGRYNFFMAQAGMLNSPAEMLIKLGISPEVSRQLAQQYDAERIDQVIEHFHAASETDSKKPGWIVSCLRGDWLAHILFSKDAPSDWETAGFRENRLLAGQGRFVNEVEQIINGLSRLQWEGFAEKAVRTTVDEWYKKLIFRNPTRSNWLLCEKVFALWKRNYQNTFEYHEHVARRTGSDQK
jgi:hypothetical protein